MWREAGMTPTLGPDTLSALCEHLKSLIPGADHLALLDHVRAWEGDRKANAGLSEQLSAVQHKLEVLEQDRQWWQDNAIKRRKRAERRRQDKSTSDR
jgi:hypothetical protein